MLNPVIHELDVLERTLRHPVLLSHHVPGLGLCSPGGGESIPTSTPAGSSTRRNTQSARREWEGEVTTRILLIPAFSANPRIATASS